MNGYTLPAVVIAVLSLIVGFVADAAEPVFVFVGGGAAVGAALFSTFTFSFSEEPDYGHAAGQGTVAGGPRRRTWISMCRTSSSRRPLRARHRSRSWRPLAGRLPDLGRLAAQRDLRHGERRAGPEPALEPADIWRPNCRLATALGIE